MKEYILVFDAGTGSIRAVLFDTDGQQVAASQYEWTHLADPRYPGSMDFDVETNWKLVKQCTLEVLKETKIDPNQIAAISATSMREGLVLYDNDGKEIWACANVDARAADEVKQLKLIDSELESKIYSISGQTFALGALPRLLWLKNNEPEIYEKTAAMAMLNDWILYKLTGELQVDPSNGCTTGIFNIEDRSWATSIADVCEIKNNIFPSVREAGEHLGQVTAEAAVETGLAEGTPVVSGAGDAQAATVGVGAIEEGQTFVCGGSFWQQEVNIKHPVIDDQSRIRVNCHAITDLWQIETIAFFPGLVMRWFRDAFCDSEKLEAKQRGVDTYQILEEKAKDVPAGSNGIMPIFSDVMNYISWRHASPSFINLSLDPEQCGKPAIFRSIQENAAIVTLGNLRLIEEQTGTYPDEVIFAGGASKGVLWSQILADVLGVPVKVPVIKEAAALGTAMMAGVGVGLYKDLQQAKEQFVDWENTYTPNNQNHEIYKDLFEKWRSLYNEQLKLAEAGLTDRMWKAPGL